VTGSTALGERLDPESLRRVMARYFDAMRMMIERHGGTGTVEKFIGDAVMAVLGVPVLHEDDALLGWYRGFLDLHAGDPPAAERDSAEHLGRGWAGTTGERRVRTREQFDARRSPC
jgi:class 3 adenylate cyclase